MGFCMGLLKAQNPAPAAFGHPDALPSRQILVAIWNWLYRTACLALRHTVASIIRNMRINLVTPFAEKDAVKALGARWDAIRKLWYITDVADLTPFLRWIPNMEAATENPTSGATRPAKNTAKVTINQSNERTPKPTLEVPHCGCHVLPWEHCVHTAPPSSRP